MEKIKIFIAEDHTLVRKGLIKLIDSFPNCKVIGEAVNGVEVLQAFENNSVPDILILDINMPEMDGYETAQAVKTKFPAVNILVLTMFDTELAVIRLMQRGVKSVLKKDAGDEELLKAITLVQHGEYYFSGSMMESMVGYVTKEKHSGSSYFNGMLTDEEISFIKLSSTDLGYKEIAEKMGLGVRIVESLKISVFEKLGMKSRPALVLYAVKNGIVHF